MNIETARMVIRDFTINDINDMQDILGDAETMKNCEPAYTIEKTADFLQKFCIEKGGGRCRSTQRNRQSDRIYSLQRVRRRRI